MAVRSGARKRKMPEKVKIARLSLKVTGVLFLTAALLFLFILISGNVLVGFGGARRELLGNRLLGGIGILLLLACAAAGVLCLKAVSGVALREKKSRTVGIGIGVLLIPLVPFGPVLGIFVLGGLLGEDARAWFARGGTPPRPRPLRELERVRPRDEKHDEDQPAP